MKNPLIAFEMGMSCTAHWNDEVREAATIANWFDRYIEVVGVTRPLPTSLLVGEMDTYSAEALRPCTEGDAYAAFEKSFGVPHSPRAFNWNGLVEMDTFGPHARIFDPGLAGALSPERARSRLAAVQAAQGGHHGDLCHACNLDGPRWAECA
jgi:hypothetical protein